MKTSLVFLLLLAPSLCLAEASSTPAAPAFVYRAHDWAAGVLAKTEQGVARAFEATGRGIQFVGQKAGSGVERAANAVSNTLSPQRQPLKPTQPPPTTPQDPPQAAPIPSEAY